MLDNILDLLKLDEYKNGTERIEIAKGKYQLATDRKTSVKKFKRSFKTLTTILWPKRYK